MPTRGGGESGALVQRGERGEGGRAQGVFQVSPYGLGRQGRAAGREADASGRNAEKESWARKRVGGRKVLAGKRRGVRGSQWAGGRGKKGEEEQGGEGEAERGARESLEWGEGARGGERWRQEIERR